MPHSPPDRIRIPAIGVDAPLIGLGLTPQGSLDVPPAQKKNLAGWYEAGTSPGERGTAIVAGHVDNAEGPAVFYDLGSLRRAAGRGGPARRQNGRFHRRRRRGVRLPFLPRREGVRRRGRPELRVITCGGGYSPTTGYQGNVVVFAHLTGSSR